MIFRSFLCILRLWKYMSKQRKAQVLLLLFPSWFHRFSRFYAKFVPKELGTRRHEITCLKIHFDMKDIPSRMKQHFFPEGLFIISGRVCRFAQSSGDISARSTSSAAIAGHIGIACAAASSVSLAAYVLLVLQDVIICNVQMYIVLYWNMC